MGKCTPADVRGGSCKMGIHSPTAVRIQNMTFCLSVAALPFRIERSPCRIIVPPSMQNPPGRVWIPIRLPLEIDVARCSRSRFPSFESDSEPSATSRSPHRLVDPVAFIMSPNTQRRHCYQVVAAEIAKGRGKNQLTSRTSQFQASLRSLVPVTSLLKFS